MGTQAVGTPVCSWCTPHRTRLCMIPSSTAGCGRSSAAAPCTASHCSQTPRSPSRNGGGGWASSAPPHPTWSTATRPSQPCGAGLAHHLHALEIALRPCIGIARTEARQVPGEHQSGGAAGLQSRGVQWHAEGLCAAALGHRDLPSAVQDAQAAVPAHSLRGALARGGHQHAARDRWV